MSSSGGPDDGSTGAPSAQHADTSSFFDVDAVRVETSLVIAVCVLGTLVGVGVLVAVAFLLLRCFCAPQDRRWVSKWVRGGEGRRRKRSRADMELEQLAAVTGNFISESMLPGNRTGASEILGIRSPNPGKIPALRVPEDLSPSPPFLPNQGGSIRAKKPRSRLPSPNRGQHLTVLNTLVPQHTLQRAPHGRSNDESEKISVNSQDYKMYRTSNKGEYARIPNSDLMLRKKHHRQCVRQGADGYPVSNQDSEDEQAGEMCADYGHSYYKPGGYTSYIPTNIFDRSKKHDKTHRSGRKCYRNLYSKIPACDISNDDINAKSYQKRKNRSKNAEQAQIEFDQNEDIERRNRFAHRSRDVMHSDATTSRRPQHSKNYISQSPPLASSSRNTSMDCSAGSASMKHHRVHQCRKTRNDYSCSMAGAVAVHPRNRLVTCRLEQQVYQTQESDINNKVSQQESEEISVRRKPLRVPRKIYIDVSSKENEAPQSHIVCIPQKSANAEPAGVRNTGPVTVIQTSNGLVPASSIIVPEPSIQSIVSINTSSSIPSFRKDNIVASHVGSTNIHANSTAAVTCCTSLTLPSLSGIDNPEKNDPQTPSVLYQHSYLSSTHSLRPSNTSVLSRTPQVSALETPVTVNYEMERISNNCLNKYSYKAGNVLGGAVRRDSRCEKSDATSQNTADSLTHLSVAEEDLEGEDPQAPDRVPPSPPASTTSSSEPEMGTAIVRCDLPSEGDKTRATNQLEETSYMDSRDVVDPTTASMSWDHLTPDPSPVLSMSNDCPGSYYTRNYEKLSIEETPNEFDDTFAREYSLKPYKKIEIASSTRITANLNPAIQHMSVENPRTKYKNILLKKASEICPGIPGVAPINCTSLDQTVRRQDVGIKQTNIVDRFYQSNLLPKNSLTSTKSDDSFSSPSLLIKKSGHSEVTNKNKSLHYVTQCKQNLLSRDGGLKSPDFPVCYSKLKKSVSAQSTIDQ